MRVLITGAATGIGAQTVALLKRRGCEVTALDIAQPQGVDRWLPVDLGDRAATADACAQLDGPFDVLVNNAGLPPRPGNGSDVLRVNWFGLRDVTKAMLPKIVDGGRIVHTASRAGLLWRENIAQVKALMALKDADALEVFITDQGIDHTRAYILSKEAVIAYTKATTAAFLARGIRVNSVSPAPIATGILDDFIAAIGERAVQTMQQTGRAGTPEEVAHVIAFLAHPDSHWIKGEDIVVDGGISAMSEARALGLVTQ